MQKNSNSLDKFFRSENSVKSKKNITQVAEIKQNERIIFLQKEILHHQDLYYNKEAEISASEFDLLVNQLKKLDPNNEVLNLIDNQVLVNIEKYYEKQAIQIYNIFREKE